MNGNGDALRLRVPTFFGRHNRTRCLAWLCLYDCHLARQPGLRLRELADVTGISYKSLSVCLTKWIRWQYVGFRPRKGGRTYYLRARGIKWVDRWQYDMPYQQYRGELEAARQRASPVRVDLLLGGQPGGGGLGREEAGERVNERGQRRVDRAVGDRVVHPGPPLDGA